MCSNKEWFDTYEKEDGGEVMMGDGSMCRVKGTDTIKVKMHDRAVRTLEMVRRIPKLLKNLISLETLDKNGYSFKAIGGKLIISKGSLVIMKGEVQPNCLYRLCGTTVTGGAAVSTSKDSDDETQLWNLRLGHMSERGMQELHNRKLLKGVQSFKLEFCRFCTMGKQSKIAFKQRNKEEESTSVLDYIHTDVWGPSQVKSNEKSEIFTKFKEWKAEVENLTGRKIKILKSDNGGEYKDNKFLEFCRSEGIKRHFTVKKTPQQNGAARG
ncbi:hypothetical protein L3X38_033033 [Prunus dulcis]|uniref:Integrase catalytic domain-containing protein n=1 Tax=Prunus dulcis TaxID=3755 RepID=A0AAD4VF74_PRUDU|nr:hypothetical protein L3X38_033033 [Prunus dulcis]